MTDLGKLENNARHSSCFLFTWSVLSALIRLRSDRLLLSLTVVDRDLEAIIATQFLSQHPLGPQVDFALGGGRCFFLPNSTTGSCRPDDQDLFDLARKNGMPTAEMITSASELLNLKEDRSSLGTVGLFNLDVCPPLWKNLLPLLTAT